MQEGYLSSLSIRQAVGEIFRPAAFDIEMSFAVFAVCIMFGEDNSQKSLFNWGCWQGALIVEYGL